MSLLFFADTGGGDGKEISTYGAIICVEMLIFWIDADI
jgi:hypothetical protein